jgi:Ca2+-binding EF-hand superfamily protein
VGKGNIMQKRIIFLSLVLILFGCTSSDDKNETTDKNKREKAASVVANKDQQTETDRILDRFDKDADGLLSRMELEAFVNTLTPSPTPVLQGTQSVMESSESEEPLSQAGKDFLNPVSRKQRGASWPRWDTDGDGQLSETEKSAMQNARQERRKAILEKWDADDDGKISDSEKIAMRMARQKQRRHAFLQKWDSDGDGELSSAEKTIAREQGRKMRKERLSLFDGDGDGRLSAQERKAMRKARRSEISQDVEK